MTIAPDYGTAYEEAMAVIARIRARRINDAARTITEEREFLESGVAREVRTIRLMAFRNIRRAQRELARIANELMAEAR